jgi:hypothetical protein
MATKTKPSERFCKHGFLTKGEKYSQLIHKYGGTVKERCGDYYTPEEIARMEGEIRVAECGICLEILTDKNNCFTCSDGHSFHETCLTAYWARDPAKQNFCPTTNSIPTGQWQRCSTINDINSGGRRKTINKKRKSRKIKKSRKYIKSRKSIMSRK